MDFAEMQRTVWHVEELMKRLESVEALILDVDECDDKEIYDAALLLRYHLTVKIRALMGADEGCEA